MSKNPPDLRTWDQRLSEELNLELGRNLSQPVNLYYNGFDDSSNPSLVDGHANTPEPVCSCGIWSVYGRSYPNSKHPDYCDLVRTEK